MVLCHQVYLPCQELQFYQEVLLLLSHLWRLAVQEDPEDQMVQEVLPFQLDQLFRSLLGVQEILWSQQDLWVLAVLGPLCPLGDR